MRSIQVGLVLVMTIGLAGVASAQESEFQAKMQEDLDGYMSRLDANCGFSGTVKWTGGKLGHNPRQPEQEGWNALSTLCTTGLDVLSSGCQENAPIKRMAGAVKAVQCRRGQGKMKVKKSGSTLVFTVDGSYTRNNASGQASDLSEALKRMSDN